MKKWAGSGLEQQYFSDRGYRDQHAGGLAFAHDEAIMGWLFEEHDELKQ